MANGPVNPKLHKDLLLACGWGKEIDVVLLLQQGASVKVQDQVIWCNFFLVISRFSGELMVLRIFTILTSNGRMT